MQTMRKDIQGLESIREELLKHPIYLELNTPEKVKIFMKHHVFAVWDFMSLLKRLQASVTTVTVPWFPYEKPLYSRLINEIVVAEESDIDGKGGFSSHFQLYLEAMEEVAADKGPINSFIKSLKVGTSLEEAIKDPEIPPSVASFVKFNLDMAQHGELYEVAAAFFYGREGLIPDMFRPLLISLKNNGASRERLLFYINRHIEVDEEHHGPLAKELLLHLCGNNEEKIANALEVGEKCLQARIKLWDGVLQEIKEKQI